MTPMTKEDFKCEMRKISEASKDIDFAHWSADVLMCEILTSLGYGDGVAVFENMYTSKWYSQKEH